MRHLLEAISRINHFPVMYLLLLMISFSVSAKQKEKSTDYQQKYNVSEEKRLINQLLHKYRAIGKMGRPVYNVSKAVHVQFGLGLIQLDLDEKQRILTLSMWTRYQWFDEYLTWNPNDYGNVSTIRLDHDMIWKPDIMLYNTAEVTRTFRDSQAVIAYTGSIQWFPHTIFRSSCSVDVTNFPFDEQECHMWFGSWTHPSQEIDLHMGFPHGIDLSTFQSDYKESCSWEIVNVTAERTIVPSETEQPNFVILKFHLDLKRKHVLSTYILTLPCIFLACLTLVVFWLPPDRPDRTGLAMSIFGSLMFLLLILVGAAPPSGSSIPTLGIYYSFNMTIIMFAIILSSLVVNLSKSNGRHVPRWLLYIIDCRLCRLLGDNWCPQSSPHGKNHRNSFTFAADHFNRTLRCDDDADLGTTGMLENESITKDSDFVSCNRDNGGRNSIMLGVRRLDETISGNGGNVNNTGNLPSMDMCSNEEGLDVPHRVLNLTEQTGENDCGKENSDDRFQNELWKLRGIQNKLQRNLSDKTWNDIANSGTHCSAHIRNHIDSMQTTLCRIERKIEDWKGVPQQKGKVKNDRDWQRISATLDRLFFVLYIIIIITSLLVLFPRPRPHLSETQNAGEPMH